MAWSDSQHRGWINSAGLGLDPLKCPCYFSNRFALIKKFVALPETR
jgi:hypothetical protein